MRLRAGKLLSLLAWTALSACGPRPGAESASDLQLASLGEPATAARVVGCWFLRWNLRPVASAAPLGQLPDSVRFRGEVVFGTRERIVAPATHPSGRADGGAVEQSWEARFVVNRWWIEDDALQIRFSDGERAEWNVTLGVDTEDLVGDARYRSVPGGLGQAGVRATRIPCDF